MYLAFNMLIVPLFLEDRAYASHEVYSEIVNGHLKSSLEAYSTPDQKVAENHAFLRDIGYSYCSGYQADYRKTISQKQVIKSWAIYKMQSIRVSGFVDIFSSAFGLFTKMPSTLIVSFNTNIPNEEMKLDSLSVHLGINILSSHAWNYNQNFECPKGVEF